MKTALLALLLAFPAAAEDLKCEPRKDLARALSEKWGETTVFTGAGPNGASIEISDAVDGLLHVSDMSWTKKIGNPAEVFEKGTKVKALVLSVDKEKKRIALGMKQLELDPWQHDIADRFAVGTEHVGEVTKVTNFGVFVALEKDLEGLLHISELTPSDNLAPGTKVGVKVIRIDTDERKIGLTLVRSATPAS